MADLFPHWNAALLRWLHKRRSPFLRALSEPWHRATFITAAGASGLLLRYLRRKNAELGMILNVPLSRLLSQIERNEVAAAVLSTNLCAFRTRDGTHCRASLLPQDSKLLTKLLHKNGVEFRAQGQAGWRAALVLLVPFIYLGLCSWLLWKLSNDSGFSGGKEVEKQLDEKTSSPKVMWSDLAGIDRVKGQLMEVRSSRYSVPEQTKHPAPLNPGVSSRWSISSFILSDSNGWAHAAPRECFLPALLAPARPWLRRPSRVPAEFPFSAARAPTSWRSS